MRIPITVDFDQTGDILGGADFTPEGIKKIHEMIEAGFIPQFGVGFVGEPDENGVYHNVELKEVSMLTHPNNYKEE